MILGCNSRDDERRRRGETPQGYRRPGDRGRSRCQRHGDDRRRRGFRRLAAAPTWPGRWAWPSRLGAAATTATMGWPAATALGTTAATATGRHVERRLGARRRVLFVRRLRI